MSGGGAGSGWARCTSQRLLVQQRIAAAPGDPGVQHMTLAVDREMEGDDALLALLAREPGVALVALEPTDELRLPARALRRGVRGGGGGSGGRRGGRDRLRFRRGRRRRP